MIFVSREIFSRNKHALSPQSFSHPARFEKYRVSGIVLSVKEVHTFRLSNQFHVRISTDTLFVRICTDLNFYNYFA